MRLAEFALRVGDLMGAVAASAGFLKETLKVRSCPPDTHPLPRYASVAQARCGRDFIAASRTPADAVKHVLCLPCRAIPKQSPLHPPASSWSGHSSLSLVRATHSTYWAAVFISGGF